MCVCVWVWRHYSSAGNTDRETPTHSTQSTENTNTHTHTHTHTDTCFAILVGTLIGVMVFLLYRPYILSPYTNPTPKLSPHRRLFAFLHFQKTSFCVIYKLVYRWRPQFRSPPWHKSPWVCVYSGLSPHRYIKTKTHTQAYLIMTSIYRLISWSLSRIYHISPQNQIIWSLF